MPVSVLFADSLVSSLYYLPIINPAIKYINDVILSNAKNLAFSLCYEILHCVQDDNDNCRVNRSKI
jgi:hypothetical protein